MKWRIHNAALTLGVTLPWPRSVIVVSRDDGGRR